MHLLTRSDSTPVPGNTDSARPRDGFSWRPRSDRELRMLTGFLLWISPVITNFAASFSSVLCPENAAAWRYGLGIPAALFAFAHITLFRRLGDRALNIALHVSAFLGVTIYIPLFFASPAVWGVNLGVLMPVIASGFYLRGRGAMLVTAYASLVAAIPVLFDLAGGAPSDASRVFVYVPMIWAVSFALRSQRNGIDAAIDHVEKLAFHDPLTGLANRRRLTEQFDLHAARDEAPFSLLLIDLDNFKNANTLYGHLGGDHALRVIGDRLTTEAVPGHVVARIGGDEFAVLVPGVSGDRVRHYADGYRAAVLDASSTMDLPGVDLDASIGSAVHPDDGKDLDELLTVADESMYAEKEKHHQPAPVAPRATAQAEPPPVLVEAAEEGESEWRVQSAYTRWLRGRPPFSRFVGSATIAAALLLLASLAVPGADDSYTNLAVASALAGAVAGLAILLIKPRHGGWMHRVIDLASVTGIALMMAFTGGVESPALPLAYLLIVGQAWFWSVRVVAWRIVLPVALILSPIVYDSAFRQDDWQIAAASIASLLGVGMTLILALSVANVTLLGIRRRQRRLALTDPLTEMPNRRAFGERIEQEIDAAAPDNRLAVVMIDMDNFKDINTKLGHRVGDELLVEIGGALAVVARSTDLVARVGGDEFAAVLPDAGVDGARLLAERFVAAVAIATERTARETGIHVTASAGFALYPLHGSSLDELIRSADEALMAVKREGKAGTRVSDVVKAV